MISSIVLHILGSVYYKEKNNSFTNTYVVDKINEARILMKENIEDPLSPEEIAARLGLGYSWFRRMFKEYTGVSPAQYQLQQKLLRRSPRSPIAYISRMPANSPHSSRRKKGSRPRSSGIGHIEIILELSHDHHREMIRRCMSV